MRNCNAGHQRKSCSKTSRPLAAFFMHCHKVPSAHSATFCRKPHSAHRTFCRKPSETPITNFPQLPLFSPPQNHNKLTYAFSRSKMPLTPTAMPPPAPKIIAAGNRCYGHSWSDIPVGQQPDFSHSSTRQVPANYPLTFHVPKRANVEKLTYAFQASEMPMEP